MQDSCVSRLEFAIAGGDRRNDFLAARLTSLGARARLVRRRPPLVPGVGHHTCLSDALSGAHVLVCPMPPFGPGGRVWSEDPEDALFLSGDDLGKMVPPALVLAGSFPPDLAAAVAGAGCQAVALGDLDDLAILNSIPTAEGAVMMALERTRVTIHGSRAAVIGYGRTGQTMAATLAALGARVTVVARRPDARARAVVTGCVAVDFSELRDALEGARFVFNTVPAAVLGREALSVLDGEAVVIDLASGKGGTDFDAAAEFGLKAVLAPGLPGRVAPETAATYLASVILRLIDERLDDGAAREVSRS
ncbi:MAG: dipicolinate synthase subunit DpsA [Bacillota bacterium]|nr:MAG: dipicolinate synthase subunit DpsA [Bacillota bacterium]